jgi:hypothetical protein
LQRELNPQGLIKSQIGHHDRALGLL